MLLSAPRWQMLESRVTSDVCPKFMLEPVMYESVLNVSVSVAGLTPSAVLIVTKPHWYQRCSLLFSKRCCHADWFSCTSKQNEPAAVWLRDLALKKLSHKFLLSCSRRCHSTSTKFLFGYGTKISFFFTKVLRIWLNCQEINICQKTLRCLLRTKQLISDRGKDFEVLQKIAGCSFLNNTDFYPTFARERLGAMSF